MLIRARSCMYCERHRFSVQVRKKILSWEAAALRDGQKVSIEGAFSATRDIASALKVVDSDWLRVVPFACPSSAPL